MAVTAAGEIGRRVHPVTERLVVYVAAVPAGDGEARAGEELTEVMWMTLEEAGQLTFGTIFEPVRGISAHLLSNSRHSRRAMQRPPPSRRNLMRDRLRTYS